MDSLPKSRGCTNCEAVGEICPDCEEHLSAELILYVKPEPGSPAFIFTGFQHYLEAVEREHRRRRRSV